MKQTLYILFLFLIIMSCDTESQENLSAKKKIDGLSLVASRDSIKPTEVTVIKEVNANYVALIPFGFIKDINHPTVEYVGKQWYGETMEGVQQYAKEIRSESIKIMLKPQIWVWGGHYTGTIKMTSEENWKTLENTYETFILDYAKLAEKLNIEIFCIGTELELFVNNRPRFWNDLITKVNNVYSGKLTYAANWDEYKDVTFWKQLDFIGIDAYFPLSNEKTPSIEQLKKGWQPHKTEIKSIQQQHKKPILFTEFGYRSVDFTAKQPWESSYFKEKINLEAQNNALQAIYDEFWNENWFAGGFLWKWFHNHEQAGGENDNRFTPQNKPSQKLIQKLYEN